MTSDNTNKILSALALASILIFLMAIFPATLGLAKEGFDTTAVFNQFVFYISLGGISLLGVLVIWFYENFNKYKDSEYGSGIGFAPPGERPAFQLFKKITSFQLFLISFIILGILGLFAFISSPQTAFTGVGTLGAVKQQFTAFDNIMFTNALVPAAENLGAMFIMALCIFGLRFYARKNNITKQNFNVLVYVIPIIVGFYGLLMHQTVYANQDLNLITVFFFWVIMSFLTIVTGSFIPGWLMHIFNNLFYGLKSYLSNEAILLWIGFIILIAVVLYVYLYFIKNKQKEFA